jgi:general secretion pathway protein L
MRTAVRRRRTLPVLAFDGDRAVLWEPVAREGSLQMIERAAIALTGDASTVAAAGRAAMAAAARAAGSASSTQKVVLTLSARQMLRRTLTLPAAVEENLRQVIGYDLDRHTPFKADELYFDALVVGRDPAKNEIRVDLAAAKRSVVDHALRHAESFGATVVAVGPDAPGATSSRLNLLPADLRPSDSAWRRWQFWLPLALLAAAAFVALILPVWQKRAYAITLSQATSEARKEAAVSEALRAELERLVSEYNFVLERKYVFPSNVEVLQEVTKLLPDDTWLLQMEVKNVPRAKEPQRELLLRGESANAGRLISAVEESKVFMQAAPRSPTTKIQPGPGEIFDLAAQVRPTTPPVPLALASAADAPQSAEGGGAAKPVDAPAPSAAPAGGGPAAASPVPAAPPPAAAAPAAAPPPPAATSAAAPPPPAATTPAPPPNSGAPR